MPATFWQFVRLLVFIVRGHGPLLQALTVGSDAERGNYDINLVLEQANES